jgi:hypothetical protein
MARMAEMGDLDISFQLALAEKTARIKLLHLIGALTCCEHPREVEDRYRDLCNQYDDVNKIEKRWRKTISKLGNDPACKSS